MGLCVCACGVIETLWIIIECCLYFMQTYNKMSSYTQAIEECDAALKVKLTRVLSLL